MWPAPCIQKQIYRMDASVCNNNETEPAKIIFDMDGVITSEQCYWDTAALSVWELLYSSRHLGLERHTKLPQFRTAGLPAGDIARVRRVIFQDDRVIAFFKKRAVNSNWDLAFLTAAFQLVCIFKELNKRGIKAEHCFKAGGAFAPQDLPALSSLLKAHCPGWGPSFEDILTGWAGEDSGSGLFGRMSSLLPPDYRKACGDFLEPCSPFWKGVQEIFQEWYFGEEKLKAVTGREHREPGKEGLIYREEPVIPVEKISDTLKQLRAGGWVLGIATGRPWNELHHPLDKMGLRDYFDRSAVVTFDDVMEAQHLLEREGRSVSLGKPHPFSFLKACFGRSYEREGLYLPPFRRPLPGKCWIVGDSMADLLAAREMGAPFLAVLTGHAGAAGRSILEKEGAHAVLPDITYLARFFKNTPIL